MSKLDDLKQIQKLDGGGVLESIASLDKQIRQAWEETQKLILPEEYKGCNNVVVCGMGGSTLGTHIIKTLFAEELDVPLEIVNDYKLPNFADDDTLCILSSYSGNTEEVMKVAEEAVEKQLKIVGICAGGELAEFLKSHNFPAYIFEPKFNVSGQPRLGLGYSIMGQLGILCRAGFLDIEEKDINEIIGVVKKIGQNCVPEIDTKNNPAKELAGEIHGKIAVAVGSEFLAGNLHVLANQINENSKNFAAYFLLPELNHHLLEGLGHPEACRQLHFLFINSRLYHERTGSRYHLTEEVVKKNNISYSEFVPTSRTKLLQSFEILSLGSFISFYLAILNGEDPSKIPWVNYLKNKLREA
ncbi:MAG: SIS domain-containing protein [Patescibacteria group bacterium]|nr:SIS domain-containing protein [Patescibacteria group bacterium]MDD5490825.1 SIS domain-containing protein [Patescibacteria group bacterium]